MGHGNRCHSKWGRGMNQIKPVSNQKPDHRQSALDVIRQQRPQARLDLSRRSGRVDLLKLIFPGIAVLLLVVLAFAPSWRSGPDANRVTYHLSKIQNDATSSMEDATYHGIDQQGQPYVITATSVVQKAAGTMTLASPQASMALKSGLWMMLKSDSGAYLQKADDLNLANNVTLYRNDGTVMTTSQASINLRASSAMGTAPVQVSGPFGVLKAQNGFTLADHGDQIMFHGPATLTLNQAP